MPDDDTFVSRRAAKVEALSKQMIKDTEARLARSYELLRKTRCMVDKELPAAKDFDAATRRPAGH